MGDLARHGLNVEMNGEPASDSLIQPVTTTQWGRDGQTITYRSIYTPAIDTYL